MNWNDFDLRKYLQDLEREKIEQALQDSKGVVAQAARKLKLARTCLIWKLEKLGLRG